MRRPLRLALGILGLAAAVYGAASLTGGWLGTPPRWDREETATEYHDRVVRGRAVAGASPGRRFDLLPDVKAVPREGRELISGGVTVAGLALLAFAAVVRHDRDAPPARRRGGRPQGAPRATAPPA